MKNVEFCQVSKDNAAYINDTTETLPFIEAQQDGASSYKNEQTSVREVPRKDEQGPTKSRKNPNHSTQSYTVYWIVRSV